MNELPRGTVGQLAVRGPTGCRYLADERQTQLRRDGWNLTGDTFVEDEDGYFHFVARSDDMIISAGYNIAGPEVEAALLSHPAVAECAVIGAPDEARGQIVEAYVVLTAGVDAGRGAGDARCRTTSRRRSRPTNIRARSSSSTPAEDRDRQAPALCAAPDGAGGHVAGHRRRIKWRIVRDISEGTDPGRRACKRRGRAGVAAERLADAKGLCQRHGGRGPHHRHRRRDRLGCRRVLGRRLCRAGAPDAEQISRPSSRPVARARSIWYG